MNRSCQTGKIHFFVSSLVGIAGFFVYALWGMQGGDGSCVPCHSRQTPAMVMEWERSLHAKNGVGCPDCHQAEKSDPDAWEHHGEFVSVLVTPKDCSRCHDLEYREFSQSHHARAGEILASLDNVLAEKVAGMPGNIADAVNGCWQCHGSIIKFKRNPSGQILKSGKEAKPILDPDSWPNSGMGRLNPDGSKGSCHACHSRHSFEVKLARAPENCGKCHMGPDHPQIEIYNESKHGIAFYANRDRMALDKQDQWVLGRDYSAAPTCATCHTSAFQKADGNYIPGSHDVGERISWTLRPVISSRLNQVIYTDGFKEDYPHTRTLPGIGEEVETKEMVLEGESLATQSLSRKVAGIITWSQRRDAMKGVCLNCHGQTHVDNFYKQFDDLVVLYNEKFARPAEKFIADLVTDDALNPKSPFGKKVQWTFWELWHHEGRRARHGASMMGPDYTHWHGMYEVSKHFYLNFLPEVIETAGEKSPELKKKYGQKVERFMENPEHLWIKGLSKEELETLLKTYKNRYKE